MKVLIISHNVFSNTNNMGKTLSSYFKNFDAQDLAQFYIHSEIPTQNCCNNYYRFTDKEAIKSILGFGKSQIYNVTDIKNNLNKESRKTDNLEKYYQFGRKRSPFIYILRNSYWGMCRLYTKKFKNWLNNFKPDIIFFAAGDYSFMYRIALKIKSYINCPLITCCVDDYFINVKNGNKLLGKYVHSELCKAAKKVIIQSSAIFTISEIMAKDYETLFNKKCYVLHTGASFELNYNLEFGHNISYIGNLDFDRYKQLIDIGKTLLKISNNKLLLNVYSGEKNKKILSLMNKDNGINFCGFINSNEVKNVMDDSMLIIHTESFEESKIKEVKYSVSTKIADSLTYGPCLLAYGPNNVASIKYLNDNNAAYIIDKKDDLETKLREILYNKKLREEKIQNARKLARRNHTTDATSKFIKNKIYEIKGV